MDDMASLLTKEVEEASMPTENPILSDEECLKERKWWCFLLSSIFTFLMGVLSVVVVRGIISICCHKEEDEFSQAELRRQEEEAKKLRLQVCAISHHSSIFQEKSMGDLYPQIIQPIHCVHSSIGTLKQALPCLRVWIFNTDPGERERRISCYTANENMSEKLSLENELLCVVKQISKMCFFFLT